jgi:integrase
MPLRVVKRPGSAALYLRGTVRGKRVFESTGTADEGLAEDARIIRENEIYRRAIEGPKAHATFAEAAAGYAETAPRRAGVRRFVAKLLIYFRATKLRDIDQLAVDGAYRALLGPDVKAATKLRAVLTPLKAVMEHAARRKLCDRPSFETPAVAPTTTTPLLPHEATALVQAASPTLRPLLVFLIGTGVRMSEAIDLEWSKVDLRGARAVVRQKQGNERRLDLAPVVIAALSAMPGRTGFVFRPAPVLRRGEMVQGARYPDTDRESGGQIKRAWASACRAAGLPGRERAWTDAQGIARRQFVPEHTPHDCRHTWASWHYAVHRDMLRLKHEGGWATMAMVERYAHLMPAAYADEARAWMAAGNTKLVQVAV